MTTEETSIIVSVVVVVSVLLIAGIIIFLLLWRKKKRMQTATSSVVFKNSSNPSGSTSNVQIHMESESTTQTSRATHSSSVITDDMYMSNDEHVYSNTSCIIEPVKDGNSSHLSGFVNKKANRDVKLGEPKENIVVNKITDTIECLKVDIDRSGRSSSVDIDTEGKNSQTGRLITAGKDTEMENSTMEDYTDIDDVICRMPLQINEEYVCSGPEEHKKNVFENENRNGGLDIIELESPIIHNTYNYAYRMNSGDEITVSRDNNEITLVNLMRSDTYDSDYVNVGNVFDSDPLKVEQEVSNVRGSYSDNDYSRSRSDQIYTRLGDEIRNITNPYNILPNEKENKIRLFPQTSRATHSIAVITDDQQLGFDIHEREEDNTNDNVYYELEKEIDLEDLDYEKSQLPDYYSQNRRFDNNLTHPGSIVSTLKGNCISQHVVTENSVSTSSMEMQQLVDSHFRYHISHNENTPTDIQIIPALITRLGRDSDDRRINRADQLPLQNSVSLFPTKQELKSVASQDIVGTEDHLYFVLEDPNVSEDNESLECNEC